MAEEKKKSGDKIREKTDVLFSRIGALTKIQRLLICAGTILLIGVGFYFLVFAPRLEELKSAESELDRQEETLAIYKAKAKSLPKVERQMAAAQERYNIAMTALPDKKELPSLLDEISKAGKSAGLEVLLFQPEVVVSKAFYKEIPLSMIFKGSYHQIAEFFFRVAGLNRIVNIPNMSIAQARAGKGETTQSIEMKCSAVTYMFAENTPQKATAKRGKKGKKK